MPPALQLPVGSPGKVGFATLELAPVRGLTRLVRSQHRVPLQTLRALHYDSGEPTMAYVTVISPVGGIVQGDRLRLTATVAAGGAAHVTTAAATSVYSMAGADARQETELRVEAGAYLEYVPDPLIPHRQARFRQTTRFVVHPEGALIAGDMLLPGRIHMGGEQFQYDELDLRLRALRPDDSLLFADRLLLVPQSPQFAWSGRYRAWPIMVTLYVLCLPTFRAELRTAFGALPYEPPDALVGCTELPADCGVLLRGLVGDTVTARRLLEAAWGQARRILRGTDLPPVRKY